MDHRPSVELLESVHQFPGTYQIKVIGSTADDFPGRLLAAVQEELAAASDIDHSVRRSPNGRHVALTLDLSVQTPDQVRAIYARIREVPGVTLVF
jgi:putative lipoic acid-binding regulatory protein